MFLFVVYYLKSTDNSESKVFSIFSQEGEGDGEVLHVIGPVQTCSLCDTPSEPVQTCSLGDPLLWTVQTCSLWNPLPDQLASLRVAFD